MPHKNNASILNDLSSLERVRKQDSEAEIIYCNGLYDYVSEFFQHRMSRNRKYKKHINSYEDAIQDVVIAIYKRLIKERYQPSDYISNYIFHNANNALKKIMKEKSEFDSIDTLDKTALYNQPEIESTIAIKEIEYIVKKTVKPLDRETEEIFNLSISGLSRKSISLTVGITEHYLKINLDNTRKKIGAALFKAGYDVPKKYRPNGKSF